MIGCIALYDFDVTQFKLKEWVAYGEEWMTKNGCPPNTMGIPPSTKYMIYKNGKKKLEKENYQKEYLSFFGGGEPGAGYPWKLAAYFSVDNKVTYLCFPEETIAFSYKELEKLLMDLCQFCPPKYGIGFLREKKYGPDSYARGMSHGLKYDYEDPEHGNQRKQIHCWQTKYHYTNGTYQTGDLRDIYPFNVLSQAHLDRIVNGNRFQGWVQATPERGQLKQISETLWTWWVEPDHILAVREDLAPSGMILCL